jgi:energy-converting hydrogenase B subunit D
MNVISIVHFFILLMVGAAGTATVFTRKATNQVIGLSFFGLVLALMFLILHAPDVALSQVIVGAIALPLMLLLTLAKLRRTRVRQDRE